LKEEEEEEWEEDKEEGWSKRKEVGLFAPCLRLVFVFTNRNHPGHVFDFVT